MQEALFWIFSQIKEDGTALKNNSHFDAQG